MQPMLEGYFPTLHLFAEPERTRRSNTGSAIRPYHRQKRRTGEESVSGLTTGWIVTVDRVAVVSTSLSQLLWIDRCVANTGNNEWGEWGGGKKGNEQEMCGRTDPLP